MSVTLPTNIPAGHRRTVTAPRPTTLPALYRTAARLLAANGLHKGDYVPDPFDRRLKTRHEDRPLSVVAALRCAVASSPHVIRPLSNEAIEFLADRLEVNGQPPYGRDLMALEFHIAEWGDVEDRTTESACAVLYAAADASEVSA
ncbi:hypothetical protein HRW18_30920 [Streptomyces lunaelactis]|uniref:DUF6197 family protein n=1 Tax=Streptomyces lunaelactis TaxID=1535768 RepID=UPI00158463EC|nr:hypothetical protein [Streptomyces lunaelactis]NUK12311.1 hypothetical protein [Streptomyces lunaelactis]